MCDTNITGGKLRRHITRVHKNREDVKPHLNDAKLDSNFFAEKKIEGDTHASANVILMEIHIVQNTFIS